MSIIFLQFLCFGFISAAPQGYDYNAKDMLMEHIPLVMKLLSNNDTKARSSNQYVPMEKIFAQKKISVEEPTPFYLPVQQFSTPVHLEYPTVPKTTYDLSALTEPHAVHYESSSVASSPEYTHSDYPNREFNKEFYFVAAEPENEYQADQELESELNKLKKNIKVVFIKSPENNGALNAAAKLIKAQQANQQTQIYVLTKQPSASDLAKKLNELQVPAAQPEVVFIKYKTPQEAEEAQRTIQAQYAELDGPNHYSYGNKAKVLNYLTKTPEHDHEHVSNHYLPAKE